MEPEFRLELLLYCNKRHPLSIALDENTFYSSSSHSFSKPNPYQDLVESSNIVSLLNPSALRAKQRVFEAQFGSKICGKPPIDKKLLSKDERSAGDSQLETQICLKHAAPPALAAYDFSHLLVGRLPDPTSYVLKERPRLLRRPNLPTRYGPHRIMYSPSITALSLRPRMCELPPIEHPVRCLEDLRTYSQTTFRGTQDDSSDFMKDKFPLLLHRTPIRKGLRAPLTRPGCSSAQLPDIDEPHKSEQSHQNL